MSGEKSAGMKFESQAVGASLHWLCTRCWAAFPARSQSQAPPAARTAGPRPLRPPVASGGWDGGGAPPPISHHQGSAAGLRDDIQGDRHGERRRRRGDRPVGVAQQDGEMALVGSLTRSRSAAGGFWVATERGTPGWFGKWAMTSVGVGADGGGRTHTLSRVPDFESSASANSATSAQLITKNLQRT